MHCERRGQGSALMLLHGFTGSGAAMASLAQAFEQEFVVLSPDLPGHGRSAVPAEVEACGFADCVDDLIGLLESNGQTSACWLGYSMGARLALACAVQRPDVVSSLVLVGARAGIEEPDARAARRRADAVLAARIERDGVEAFVDEWMAQPLFASQQRLGAGFLAAARAARVANDAHGLAASLRGFGPGAQPPLFDELARLDVPTLLVVGALDAAFAATAHDLAMRLPRAEVCEIADAGHAVHLEQPEAFLSAVREFLRRGSGPARYPNPIPVEETVS
jgi:2-succinyl-6-hydroxy-2,4-cyclohexadiene-1-carboxylate synthase